MRQTVRDPDTGLLVPVIGYGDFVVSGNDPDGIFVRYAVRDIAAAIAVIVGRQLSGGRDGWAVYKIVDEGPTEWPSLQWVGDQKRGQLNVDWKEVH
jgi:hypothetical protein